MSVLLQMIIFSRGYHVVNERVFIFYFSFFCVMCLTALFFLDIFIYDMPFE